MKLNLNVPLSHNWKLVSKHWLKVWKSLKNNSTKTSNELKGQILAKDGQIKELSQKLGQLEQTLYDKEAEYKCQLEKLTEVGSEKQKELDGLVEQCKLEISQLKAERLNADETWKDEQVKLEKSYEKQISEISKSKQELEVDNQALKDKLNDISKESAELIAENEKLKQSQIKWKLFTKD